MKNLLKLVLVLCALVGAGFAQASNVVATSKVATDHATTFTWSGTSGGTSASKTLKYERDGDWVQLFMPTDIFATTGTNSALLVSNTAVATNFRPAVAQTCNVPEIYEGGNYIDRGVNNPTNGQLYVHTNGTLSIAKNAFQDFFTNSAASSGSGLAFVCTYYVGP